MNIETWKGGKTSALAITWDDLCYHSWKYCLPYFCKKNIKCTFYINTVGYYENQNDRCTKKEIDLLHDIQKAGHEIGCHTHSHIDMTQETHETIKKEIDTWYARIKEYKLNLGKDITFAYPYGNIPKHLNLIKRHFLASRMYNNNGCNSRSPRNMYRLRTINYFSSSSVPQLNIWLDKSIRTGGFLIYAGHGINGECWNPISKLKLQKHINYIHSKQSYIWNDTLLNIVKYIQQRNKIRLAVTYRNHVIICKLIFPKFKFTCVPITLSLPLETKVMKIKQGMRKIPFTKRDKYYFDVNVNQKQIKIHLLK